IPDVARRAAQNLRSGAPAHLEPLWWVCGVAGRGSGRGGVLASCVIDISAFSNAVILLVDQRVLEALFGKNGEGNPFASRARSTHTGREPGSRVWLWQRRRRSRGSSVLSQWDL